MERKTKDVYARRHGESLKQIQERFRRWRETRARGEPIPGVLWAAAVGLAREHGIERIADELRVAPAGLKKRLGHAGDAAQVGKNDTRFVELLMPAAPGSTGVCECVVEFANGQGRTMRVEINGGGLTGLSGLCAAFWSAS